jgi:hypothetical protein
MRLNTLVLFVCLSITADCFCQATGENDVRDITKVTILMPGISYEKRIGNFQTLHARVFASFSGYYSYSSYLGEAWEINIDPAVDLAYRYYYNFKKREAKNKRTAMNSANYVSPVYEAILYKQKIYFPNDDVDVKYHLLHVMGVEWGLQRNYNNRLSLDLGVGPGYSIAKEDHMDDTGKWYTTTTGYFSFIIRCNLGIWLNRRE